ncbi:signal peptidase II [Candidatus Woesearchaeota archaeon]|nr:signal peptidase II [Candidatus Woesearchaeota archaeon]
MKKFLIISALIVILDQITKFLLTDKHFWLINYVTNTGAAFSLFQNQIVLLTIISFLVAIFIFFLARKEVKLQTPLAFIFGGTIGNLIDRFFLGYVRDFIDLQIWPIFNVADSFNVIGVLIIVYLVLKEKV